MTNYDKLEERRQMARSNYYAQLAMMGYDSGGNPPDDIVRVVRCRNCKFYYGVNKECGCNGGYHSEDWFCADGKRRESE